MELQFSDPLILFEDDDMLAVNKPEGLSVIPERVRTVPCLLDYLQTRYSRKFWVVHRIDKESSGVVLFAKNAEGHRLLCRQFQDRGVRKTYVALVHGVVRGEGAAIDAPLRQFGSGRVGIDAQRGKPSLTEYRVKERFAAWTLLHVHPKTGRRHQIRAHLYSVGHPIVGDRRYGSRTDQEQFPRLMLHALCAELITPSGKSIGIEAPTPPSFQSVVDRAARDELPRASESSSSGAKSRGREETV